MKEIFIEKALLLLVTSLILVSSTSHINDISRAATNKINTLNTFSICYAQNNGKLFPIDSSRNDEYIYCFNQQDIKLKCPMGKVFNAGANGCISKNLEQFTNCDLEPNGVFECPYDCHTFIICRDGVMEIDNCPGDKIFNPILKLCDTPNAVVCSSASQPSTTTESSIIGNICTHQSNNALLPYANNCAMFIRCLNGDPELVKCPNGTLFDPDLLICLNANNVDCSQTTTGGINNTTTATTPLANENYCFDRTQGETFPYLEDCQKYYYCWGDNTSSLLPCPANNWYNPNTGRCGPEVSPIACQNTLSTTTQRTTQSPEELCFNSEIGTTHAMPSDCQQYIFCTGNGNFMILNCPANNWFNPDTGKCGPNVSPTACQDFNNIETTTTTTQKTTSSSEIGICYNKNYGEIVSYPNDCQKYVVCAIPVPVAFYCQKDYYFNGVRKECGPLEASDCKITITTTISTKRSPTLCTNATNINYPYKENCQWYYHCINDYVYVMRTCNTNEFFDPLTGECSKTATSSACTKEDYSNQITLLTSIMSGPCGNKPAGVKIPYPYDCTRFIQCNTLFPTILQCREGLEFSTEQQRCMLPDDANCSNANLVSAVTTTTTTPTYDPDMPTTKRSRITSCAHLPDYATLPYANNCSRYIICLKGKDTIANCSINSYFNINEGSCNDLTSPYACYENSDAIPTATQTTSTTTLIPPTTDSNICCGHSRGSHIPYPDDLSKFIVCAYPIPYTVTCANGTFYDENALECVEPTDSDGGNGNTQSSTESTVKIVDTENSCSNILYGTPIAYRGDCSLYVLCFGDIGALLPCNNNWYFNPKMRQCVPSGMYHCPW